jgi:ketosteroid isomerase-like protein
MTKYFILIALLLLCACQTKNNNPVDVSAIHRWIFNYEEAIRKADIEAILSGESDAVVYYPPNQPSFSGKENLRRWFIAYFNYYSPSEKLLASDIKVRGDFAYVTCRYIISAKVKYSNEEFKDSGKLINLFKRKSYGKWECTYSIWNSNNRSIDLHAQIPADFSGTWELDLSRSTDFPDLLSSKILIVQKGNEININRTYEIKNQEPITNSFKYIIGREIKTNTKTGSTTTTSSWSTDKQSFSITETLLSHNNKTKLEYKRTTTYSLTVKGEILNVNSDDILPQGSMIPTNNKHINLIYNKQ